LSDGYTIFRDYRLASLFVFFWGEKANADYVEKKRSVNPVSYTELLLSSLTQYEKNLSQIADRLEQITKKLEKSVTDFQKKILKNISARFKVWAHLQMPPSG